MAYLIVKIIDVNGDNPKEPVKLEGTDADAMKNAERVEVHVTPMSDARAVLTVLVLDANEA
jgi:hypothetical protein